MRAVNHTSIYKQAVEISNFYLGPAGERFIRRQIVTHIGVEPENLDKNDMVELVNWVKITFSLLTDNSRYVHEFADKLLALGQSSSPLNMEGTNGK